MAQRNMYTGPMLDNGNEHARLRPEPCVIPYSGIANSVQPNNRHAILPPPVNRTSFNSHRLPENHLPLPSGITQYNGVDHHHIEHSNTFVAPSPSAQVIPVPTNLGLHGQFMDGFNGAFKRKNAEGFPGNFQYFYPAPGSSSSVAVPMNTEGTMVDTASFAVPEYRLGNNVTPLAMEAGPHRSMRSGVAGAIGVDPALALNNVHFMPLNYGQALQAVPAPWLEPWNHAPAIPYIHGYINGGGMEAANMGLQGYQATAQNSMAFVLPLPVAPHQGPRNLHHPPPPPPPPPMSPLQGHNMDFHPQVAPTSRRHPVNGTTSYPGVNPFQNGVEPGPMFMGPTLHTGLRVHRPYNREVMLESTARHRRFPHLRVLPEDGVAILDISEYGRSVDHHREMRLDIDHMSYEELLALGEQIGSVGSGLSDDFILDHLKTRSFVSSSSSARPEDASSVDQELNFCVVCQTDYNDEEKIGVLDCGHEYHVDCIKQWLVVKNTCPVCKFTALANKSEETRTQG